MLPRLRNDADEPVRYVRSDTLPSRLGGKQGTMRGALCSLLRPIFLTLAPVAWAAT